MNSHYTYLLIDLLSIAIPLWRSFEPQVQFARYWRQLFPAIAITGSIFIAWDVMFTKIGVWGFNPVYLLGVDLINLPLEEWSFFLCIPYACVFTYEALNYFIKKDILKGYEKMISLGLAMGLLVTAVFHFDRIYTFTTFVSCASFILALQFIFRVKYMSRFYLSYLVIIIPFFIVNGILTGSFIEDQVVWYNNNENLGIRMGTIPLEDTFYGMLLILMNVSIYEYLKTRSNRSQKKVGLK